MVRAACLLCALSIFLVCGLGCGEEGNKIQTYHLGDRVQAGPLVYTAYDTHWYLSLGPPLGQTSAPRIPANRFLVVRMNITNGGAVDCHVPTLMLVDDSVQIYNEVADGTSIPDWMGIVRKVKPLEAEKGTVAFDVSPRHYKLRVADESDQIISYIDLPLNLVSDEKGP